MFQVDAAAASAAIVAFIMHFAEIDSDCKPLCPELHLCPCPVVVVCLSGKANAANPLAICCASREELKITVGGVDGSCVRGEEV